MDEHTTFEETILQNDTRVPSLTLCPYGNPDKNKSMESFEDVAQEIESAKNKYKIKFSEYKQFETIRNSDEIYNDTSSNHWYFAPKTSDFAPYETVVCLIWTPSREYKLQPGWGIEVSLF